MGIKVTFVEAGVPTLGIVAVIAICRRDIFLGNSTYFVLNVYSY